MVFIATLFTIQLFISFCKLRKRTQPDLCACVTLVKLCWSGIRNNGPQGLQRIWITALICQNQLLLFNATFTQRSIYPWLIRWHWLHQCQWRNRSLAQFKDCAVWSNNFQLIDSAKFQQVWLFKKVVWPTNRTRQDRCQCCQLCSTVVVFFIDSFWYRVQLPMENVIYDNFY